MATSHPVIIGIPQQFGPDPPHTMPRFTWHLGADGWPSERIDTRTGEHVPVFTGGPEELAQAGGGRPMACIYPRVAGVVWGLGGDGHHAEG